MTKPILQSHLDDVLLMLRQKLQCPVHGVVNQLLGLFVHQLGSGLAERLVEHHLARLGLLERHVPDLGVHTKLRDLAVRWLCDLLQIVLGPGRDPLEEDLFWGAASQRHAHPEIWSNLLYFKVFLKNQTSCPMQSNWSNPTNLIQLLFPVISFMSNNYCLWSSNLLQCKNIIFFFSRLSALPVIKLLRGV